MNQLDTLKSDLDKKNAALKREVNRAMRGGKGPTEEMRQARAVAMDAYRLWEAELTRTEQADRAVEDSINASELRANGIESNA